MKTPMRASCFVVLPGAGAAAGFVAGADAIFFVSVFTGAAGFLAVFAAGFLLSGFFTVVFFFSAMVLTLQNLLQERLAADRVEIKCKILRAHSLGESEKLGKV